VATVFSGIGASNTSYTLEAFGTLVFVQHKGLDVGKG
jgi:hypothetical protein